MKVSDRVLRDDKAKLALGFSRNRKSFLNMVGENKFAI